jgi:hypothetical protein
MGGSSSEKVGFSQSSPTFNITIFIAYFQRVIIKNKHQLLSCHFLCLQPVTGLGVLGYGFKGSEVGGSEFEI